MKALIAGSFDPITNGHLDIIARASKMFSEVFVVVGNNSAKKYTFESKKRKSLVYSAVMHAGHRNVHVMEFEGLLAQFMYHHNVNVLVRGVRNTTDFQEELTLAHVNKDLKGIETIFLPTAPELANVSSSMVKAIVKEHGNVEQYVPMEVKYELDRVVGGNVYVGIVGGIGAGKSKFCEDLVKEMDDIPRPGDSEFHFNMNADNLKLDRVFHINLDKLGHAILNGTEPFSLHVKEMLISYFGKEILAEDMTIDRKKLGAIVFSNPRQLAVLNEIMKKPLEHLLYEEIRSISALYPKRKRTFLIEGAMLESGGWLPFVDGHAIQIVCDKEVRRKRIASRDNLSPEAIESRISAQVDPELQWKVLEEKISGYGYGYYSQIDTSTGEYSTPIKTVKNILKSELWGL